MSIKLRANAHDIRLMVMNIGIVLMKRSVPLVSALALGTASTSTRCRTLLSRSTLIALSTSLTIPRNILERQVVCLESVGTVFVKFADKD